jgi:hypothetical protein
MIAAGMLAFAPVAAQAAPASVTVTIENLAPTNSVSFAPLGFAFHGGTYDPFNAGGVASPSLQTLAELGNPSAWVGAFAAGDPGAVVGASGGPLFPGASALLGTFNVDTAANRYFTFASMVVPSNDFFIGNDNPTMLALFDGSGNLVINQIVVTANRIWNAGSESFDPSAAAFVAGATATNRTDEGGTIGFNFSELSGFNGVGTAAGYTFDSQLAADTAIYKISFRNAGAVPEPTTWAMMIAGIGLVGGLLRRRAAASPLAA